MPNKAVVIFSGGQDSTTCLALAIKDYGVENVTAVTFDYGQKHAVEIKSARHICKLWDVDLKVLDINFFNAISRSGLTQHGDVNSAHPDNPALPASFVPNRNALLITIAHAIAQNIGASVLIGGMCQTDYSGYPDCRARFIDKLINTLNEGSAARVMMRYPLMNMTKAQTFQLAQDLLVLQVVINESHTCYNGSEKQNEWGKGCGECPACKLRQRGYLEWQATQK